MIEEILDLCLDEIRAKRTTVEDCLKKYPNYANELEPLLIIAVALESAPDIKPSPAFKSKTRAQLLQLPVQRHAFLPRFSFATVAAIILAVLALTSGLVYAANDSLPDSPLYPIKRGTENVEILLASDAESQSRTYMTFAERRLDEAKALANKREQSILAEQAIAEYNNQVNASLAAAPLGPSDAAPLTQELTSRITRQQDNLKALDKKVSASTLEKALTGAEKAKEKLNASSAKPTAVSPASAFTPSLVPSQVPKTPLTTPSITPSLTPLPSQTVTATTQVLTPSILFSTITVSAPTLAVPTLLPKPSLGVSTPIIPPIQLPPSLPTALVP